ncbi:MurG-like transferase [Poriferisphaera corsica]|uniref:MurG-like transferase n=1 Tax=Poriferisphaera corsica TaxID=2528020 RepID=A0A517YU11_9BACT|nr:glycosyltransferase [Poriferisphaera corsica]QDU33724.1 MurG-like transferase [Poriferisphaera corsica]
MRVMIATVGSRGDVQPYVALGVGLKEAGHEVVVCCPSSFKEFVEGYGLRYGYMNNEVIDLIQSDLGKELTENLTNIVKTINAFFRLYKQMGPMQQRMIDDGGEVAKEFEPDVVVYHPKASGGPWYAELVDGKAMMAVPMGMMVPSGEKPCIGFPNLRLGWLNRLTYKLVMWLSMKGIRKHIEAWRENMGLKGRSIYRNLVFKRDGEMLPVMHCYSGLVGDEPRDWPEQSVATGYWFLERNDGWIADEGLVKFLESGDGPIVYVGFGSMSGKNPERRAKAVVEGLLKAGARGVISKGWGGMASGELPDSIYEIDDVPHDWLFEKVDVVVHHGGAGSTAAGLRAGKPTIVCPFFGDQPYWGKRVWELGVGPRPIPQRKITGEKLTQAIREVLSDEKMKQKAKVLGEQLRVENGVGEGVKFVEKYGANERVY